MSRHPLHDAYMSLFYAIVRQAVIDAIRGRRDAIDFLRLPWVQDVLDDLGTGVESRLLFMLESKPGRAALRRRLTRMARQ